MFQNPTFESCCLCRFIASRSSDNYTEFLIEAGMIEMFKESVIVFNERIQPEVAFTLQYFAECEIVRAIEFLWNLGVVRFVQFVFEEGTFASRKACLIVIMRLIKKGFVEHVMREFTSAFAGLSDLIGCCVWSDEVMAGLGVVIEEFAHAEVGWMEEIRGYLVSDEMFEAIAGIGEKQEIIPKILEGLENLRGLQNV
jgi:hypothetical protein